MKKRILIPEVSPAILGFATVGGKREKEGPLGEAFDLIDTSDRFCKKTWEKAEAEMQRLSLCKALEKTGKKATELDAVFAGDLINQCAASIFGLVSFPAPFFGIFGACSTLTEGMILASLALQSPGFSLAAVVTSSHNCTAERQFRSPIEYGGQRSPTSQWTVTGAGAYLLSARPEAGAFARITALLPGIALDSGVTDSSNMGAAMAPAAADTFLAYFEENGERPEDFDRIVTGDLGEEGSSLFLEFLEQNGVRNVKNHEDCGALIYDRTRADVHSGGSGCGCAGTTLANRYLPLLQNGKMRRILFAATGALMNAASVQQGLSIPGIAHLVRLESPAAGKEEVWS
ncbi:MAG: stage V sporulation protein AD [Clostridia bacterium]|nr:stage V sporulation protein AD [Clostridia bacterium]